VKLVRDRRAAFISAA